jgi:hypothetical protein
MTHSDPSRTFTRAKGRSSEVGAEVPQWARTDSRKEEAVRQGFDDRRAELRLASSTRLLNQSVPIFSLAD